MLTWKAVFHVLAVMDAIRVARVESVIVEWSPSHTSSGSAPSRERLTGTLHLTPHHLIFSPNTSSTKSDGDEIWIPYPSVIQFTRLPQNIQGLYPVQIRTKTFEDYLLLFETDINGGAEDVWQSVKNCAIASKCCSHLTIIRMESNVSMLMICNSVS